MSTHLKTTTTKQIKQNRKRKNKTEKRQLLKVNDIIIFTNRDTGEKLSALIINLHYFDSFKELYNHFDKTMLGYLENEKCSYKDMEEYYSIEEQKMYGVVGIEIKKI